MRLAYELSSKHFFSVESEAQSAVKNISFGTLQFKKRQVNPSMICVSYLL